METESIRNFDDGTTKYFIIFAVPIVLGLIVGMDLALRILGNETTATVSKIVDHHRSIRNSRHREQWDYEYGYSDAGTTRTGRTTTHNRIKVGDPVAIRYIPGTKLCDLKKSDTTTSILTGLFVATAIFAVGYGLHCLYQLCRQEAFNQLKQETLPNLADEAPEDLTIDEFTRVQNQDDEVFSPEGHARQHSPVATVS